MARGTHVAKKQKQHGLKPEQNYRNHCPAWHLITRMKCDAFGCRYSLLPHFLQHAPHPVLLASPLPMRSCLHIPHLLLLHFAATALGQLLRLTLLLRCKCDVFSPTVMDLWNWPCFGQFGMGAKQ